MSSWETDYEFMLANEDRTQAHAVAPDAPPGAYAISGINSAAFPAEFAAIAAIPQAQRGPAVEAFYKAHESWQWLSQLTSDAVAERVLDAEVNGGVVPAVRMLQQAASSLGQTSGGDGAWGPNTVAAANSGDPSALVIAFDQARAAHYRALVAANPALAQYEAAWLARAEE